MLDWGSLLPFVRAGIRALGPFLLSTSGLLARNEEKEKPWGRGWGGEGVTIRLSATTLVSELNAGAGRIVG